MQQISQTFSILFNIHVLNVNFNLIFYHYFSEYIYQNNKEFFFNY